MKTRVLSVVLALLLLLATAVPAFAAAFALGDVDGSGVRLLVDDLKRPGARLYDVALSDYAAHG